MTDIDEDDEGRARKERSPSFPFISLPKAIERAKAVSDAHRRNPARLVAVGETWGYAPSSSGLLQTVSALKAYGLLEDIGRGADRKVQLTDLAQRIIHDSRPGAREAAIKEAALLPRLFAEYASKWLPKRPSDGHCISELTLDRGFNEQAARTFLKSFDETMIYASLVYEDLSSLDRGDVEPQDAAEQIPPMSGLRLTGPNSYATFPPSAHPHRYGGGESSTNFLGPRGATGASGSGISTGTTGPTGPSGPYYVNQSPRATLPLPEGTAAIEIPANLSRKSFEALKSWTETMVSLAERNVSSQWYVECYATANSSQPVRKYLLPDWKSVKEVLGEFKAGVPDAILRVIAPDDAPEEELAELRANGVRTF